MEEKQPNTRQEYNRETGNSRTSLLTLSDPSLAPVGLCVHRDRKLIDTTIPIPEQLDNLYQLIRSTLFTYLIMSATFSVALKASAKYHWREACWATGHGLPNMCASRGCRRGLREKQMKSPCRAAVTRCGCTAWPPSFRPLPFLRRGNSAGSGTQPVFLNPAAIPLIVAASA